MKEVKALLQLRTTKIIEMKGIILVKVDEMYNILKSVLVFEKCLRSQSTLKKWKIKKNFLLIHGVAIGL